MLLIAIAALPISFLGCGPRSADGAGAQSSYGDSPMVRVLLHRKIDQLRIASKRPPVLTGQAMTQPVRLNLPNVPVKLRLTTSGWKLGNQLFPRGELTLLQAEDGAVSINDKRYRGSYRFVPTGEDTFDVVNDLDIESYLYGVLPSELPNWWLPETFRAQAVVARTYALWEIKTTDRGHFDVYDTDASQVYGGMDAEHDKARQAVRATRGQVVVHPTQAGPRIFKAYFHSTSGGATIGVEHAFKESPMKALSAQSTGQLSRESKRFNWDPIVLEKKELTRRVVAWGKRRGHPVAKIGEISRLDIAASTPQGRPTRFELTDTKGNRYSLISEELRWAVNTDPQGGPTIYSAFFRPINNQTNIVFADGHGWGHGVGMCQFTAEARAKQGEPYRKIVTLAYPGTSVVRAY